jgi:AcrR family transcriptional regulator
MTSSRGKRPLSPRRASVKRSGPKPTGAATPVNFRTRTGQERRARTRARILAAAFVLFDSAGVGRINVEDVRAKAGLARGSFYNYFPTYEAMLRELAAEIARQLNAEQSERFDHIANLAERIWCYVRYSILRTAADRACAEILVRVTPLVGSLTDHMREHSENDMRLSLKTKAIDVPSPAIALDLGYGLVTMMLKRALDAPVNLKEIEAAGLMLLRAYGVADDEARRISRLPLAPLPDTPLRAALINSFTP